jgi:hypothetical protein
LVGEAPGVVEGAPVTAAPGVGVRVAVGVAPSPEPSAEVRTAVATGVGKNSVTGNGVADAPPPSSKAIGSTPNSAIGVPLAVSVWITATYTAVCRSDGAIAVPGPGALRVRRTSTVP